MLTCFTCFSFHFLAPPILPSVATLRPLGLCPNCPSTLGFLPGGQDNSDWGQGPGLACWSCTSVQGGSGPTGSQGRDWKHNATPSQLPLPPALYLRVWQPLPLGGFLLGQSSPVLWGTCVRSCLVPGKSPPRTQGRSLVGQASWAQSDQSESVSRSVVSDSLQLHGLQPARLLSPWNSPGKNTGVGWHSLLQEIFLTQGLNLVLWHCRQNRYHLSHQESHILWITHIKRSLKDPLHTRTLKIYNFSPTVYKPKFN